MVEIFKTNIIDKSQANSVLKNLRPLLPHCKINFDLDDCDNILRIESDNSLDIESVIAHFHETGHKVELLN